MTTIPGPRGRSASVPACIFTALVACALACDTLPTQLPSDAVPRSFSGYVPPPPDCNGGVGPNRCLHVAPVHVEQPPRWELDGVRGENEYTHAAALPYVNVAAKAAGGEVFVSVDDEFAAFHVFLERIPLLDAREIHVLLDYDRFDQSTPWVDRRDRAYSVDVDSGERHDYTGGGAQWDAVDHGGYDLVLGACEPDPEVEALRYCDVELEIVIEDDDLRHALLESAAGGDPAGIGLAVTDEWRGGSSPEEIATVSAWSLPHVDRRFYQTLLFGRPPGIPVTFVSFNVHRFTPFMQELDPTGFDEVPLQEIARLVAPFDVVAVQELWSRAQAERLHVMIQQERAALGLGGEYHWIPGGDFDPQFLLLEDFQSLADETHGGVHVYSRFPAKSSNYAVYSNCRGEDCLRAKGAQHVRLWVDPPQSGLPEGCGETLEDGAVPAEPQGCPPPSSHARTIDVFNTHLQAGSPRVCEDVGWFLAAEALLVPFGLPWYDDLLDAEFACLDTTDEEVRASQLSELDSFIAATTEGSRRPSIVLGDFNIDGRDLNAAEYSTLLQRLRIGPATDPGSPQPSDIVNPWRFDFDWDVDHGDVAREQLVPWPDPASTASKTLAGTFIGEAMEQPNERFDYILVRPPVQPDLPGAGELDFVFAKGDPVWQKIWPGGPGAAPDRFSDHELVAAALELVQFQQPPGYHGDWNHDFTWRVSAVDATGHKDCVAGFCGQLELYPRIHGRNLTASGWADLAGPWNAGNCGGNQASYPANGCTHGWGFSSQQIAGTDLALSGGAKLREDDDSSEDDTYATMSPGEHPQMFFTWGTGLVEMRDWSTGSITPSTWSGDHVLHDNAPFEWCTKGNPDKLCIRLDIAEVPPGQQF